MNNYKESKLWTKLTKECKELAELAHLEKLCNDALALMKTVRDSFPTYTLHDETHLNNVIFLMEELLGNKGLKQLSVGECAMLLLAACYHDIGMCYTQEQKQIELNSKRFHDYLDKNPGEYLKVKATSNSESEIPDDVQLNYFRKIHHLRIHELLPENPETNLVRRDALIRICESHGQDIKHVISEHSYDNFRDTDYILCALLLRLADILDFDSSRAPEILYNFQNIKSAKDPFADVEWVKHLRAKGFKFSNSKERSIIFGAVCENMQEEHHITRFLDYIDIELENAGSTLEKYSHERWRNLQLPQKIERNIERKGYQTGEYCLTLQADNILQMLVGDDLYTSDSTFIRELLQNSFDAVRARKMLDYPWSEKNDGEITISDWVDEQGFQWFRIDDTGIGMTEQMILNYFLKAGNSYYQSDEFKKIQLENHMHHGFSPISQFGIGILSCFLVGDKMEISTRHYDSGKGIRFTMNGIRGYYSIAQEEKGDKGTPMPSCDKKETFNYRQSAGTSIAIRIKESLPETIKTYLKRYICFPDIRIYYKNSWETTTFPTQNELIDIAKETGTQTISLPNSFIQDMHEKMPETQPLDSPYIRLQCKTFDEMVESPYINGTDILLSIHNSAHQDHKINIDGTHIIRSIEPNLNITSNGIDITLSYRFTSHNHFDITSPKQLWNKYSKKDGLTKIWSKNIENGINPDEIASLDLETQKVVNTLVTLRQMHEQEKINIHTLIPFSHNSYLEALFKNHILPRCVMSTSIVDNHKIEKAYDGILVEAGSEEEFYDEHKYFRYTVLLLSGEFQPKLGISREHIKYYPPKAACYIELLGRMLGHNGFSCYYPSYYTRMEFSQLLELINDPILYPHLTQVLEIRYGVKIVELPELLLVSGCNQEIHMGSFEDIFRMDHWTLTSYFLGYLFRALLQTKFEICWNMNESGHSKYFITGVRSTEITEVEKLLIPMTFVKSQTGDTTKLAEAEPMTRQMLNADHPFSVWIMNNAINLSQKQPRIWAKIREGICRLPAQEMIDTVNSFLQEIQKRERFIEIPDNVWLKKEDFIYFEM